MSQIISGMLLIYERITVFDLPRWTKEGKVFEPSNVSIHPLYGPSASP
jgi:hypothetical protein